MTETILSFFEKNFEEYKTTLKETSHDTKNDEYATELCDVVYNYDLIVKHRLFDNNSTACSPDAILFSDTTVFFIEFKNAVLEQQVESSDKYMLRRYKMKFNEEIRDKLLLKGVEGLYVFQSLLLENKINFDGVRTEYILCYNSEKNRKKAEDVEVDKIFKNFRRLSGARNVSFGLSRLANDFYYDDVRTLDMEEFAEYMDARK